MVWWVGGGGGGWGGGGGCFFFFQAEDGIRDLVRSRGLGDVYKRQQIEVVDTGVVAERFVQAAGLHDGRLSEQEEMFQVTGSFLSLIHI